jgi:hypothetical protein
MMGWIVALLCLVIHSQYLAEGFLISQVAKAAMHKKAPHDIDYETLRNVSVRAEGERYAEEDSSARRALIRKLASLPLVAGYIAPHLSTAETDCDIIQKCSNGAIVEEEAIPGAYQQFCMSLPERSVRLQVHTIYLWLHLRKILSENLKQHHLLTTHDAYIAATFVFLAGDWRRN